MTFLKLLPIISFEEFKKHAIVVTDFYSVPRLKRYHILHIEGNIIHFIRNDANSSIPWSFDLVDIHNAYTHLKNFNTVYFKKYVPRRHSPARDLLMHLKLLKQL